jgi:transposase-like protein
MPRRCTVCDHPERRGIDEALVTGAPYRSVAKRFGLSESAVYRHKTEHLPAHLLKAREVEEAARADDLLAQVRNLQTHALDILERAEKSRDLRSALSAISQARGNLELLGKLAGELDERPVVNLNISPEWLELRAVIVGALEPHPAAHGAVLRALEISEVRMQDAAYPRSYRIGNSQ